MTDSDVIQFACETHVRVFGLHVSPHNARLIHNALNTIDERVRKSSNLTLAALERLRETHPEITIIHPSLPDHPSHSILKAALSGPDGRGQPENGVLYPSVFTFKVKATKNVALKALQSNHLPFKTSFGAPMSRLDPWPQKDGDNTICRLAVPLSLSLSLSLSLCAH